MSNNYREWIVKHLNIGSEILYLTKNECEKVCPTGDSILEHVEKALGYHGKKEVDMPPKIGIHPKKDTFMHAMPAFLPQDGSCGIKWGSGFPDNKKQYGIPQISCLLIYNDAETGWPIAVMDGLVITERRTPAVSAVAAKKLANPTATTFGMIGCGVQGKGHVKLMPNIFDLKKIYVYDTYEPCTDDLINELQPQVDAKIIKAKSMEEVVKNCEVLATATIILSKPDPQIKDEWVTKGQTLLLVDLHSLFEDKTMKRADKYLVDDIGQHKEQEGYGMYPDGLPEIYGELGEVVAGLKTGRESADEVIVSNNVGMAVEDMPLAKVIFDRALEEGMGQKLTL